MKIYQTRMPRTHEWRTLDSLPSELLRRLLVVWESFPAGLVSPHSGIVLEDALDQIRIILSLRDMGLM